MPANLWTVHLTSGNSDHISVGEDIQEVIITALEGDCYVVNDDTYHPPALDEMSSSNAWAGAIVTEGTTLRFKIKDAPEDFPQTDGSLYFGPVTAGGGSCTVSVVLARG